MIVWSMVLKRSPASRPMMLCCEELKGTGRKGNERLIARSVLLAQERGCDIYVEERFSARVAYPALFDCYHSPPLAPKVIIRCDRTSTWSLYAGKFSSARSSQWCLPVTNRSRKLFPTILQWRNLWTYPRLREIVRGHPMKVSSNGSLIVYSWA